MQLLKMSFQITVMNLSKGANTDVSNVLSAKIREQVYNEDIQRKITCGKLYGELIFISEYYNTYNETRVRISHKIDRLWIENNTVCATIDILDNDNGALLRGEIQENGFKNIEPRLNYMTRYNEDGNIELNTIDLVIHEELSSSVSK